MKSVDSFSNRLSMLIAENKITYEELSKKTGENPQTLNRWALGQRVPKITVIQPLAEVFGVNPLWLAGYDVDRIQINSGNKIKTVENDILATCEEIESICIKMNEKGRKALLTYANYLLTIDENVQGFPVSGLVAG